MHDNYPLFLLLFFLLGCLNAPLGINRKEKIQLSTDTTPMSQTKNSIIENWVQAATISLKEMPPPKDLVHDVSYQKSTQLSRAELLPKQYYYFGPDRTCTIIYIKNRELINQLNLDNIQQEYGFPEEILRSRSGKIAKQHIYPNKGFAFSHTKGDFQFFEAFPPMNLSDYKAKFYEEPTFFRK